MAAKQRGVQLGRPLFVPAGLGFLGRRTLSSMTLAMTPASWSRVCLQDLQDGNMSCLALQHAAPFLRYACMP